MVSMSYPPQSSPHPHIFNKTLRFGSVYFVCVLGVYGDRSVTASTVCATISLCALPTKRFVFRPLRGHFLSSFRPAVFRADKKVSGKSKDEQMAEKKQELEKRLQDVTGQLGTNKKTPKKGTHQSAHLQLTRGTNVAKYWYGSVYCFVKHTQMRLPRWMWCRPVGCRRVPAPAIRRLRATAVPAAPTRATVKQVRICIKNGIFQKPHTHTPTHIYSNSRKPHKKNKQTRILNDIYKKILMFKKALYVYIYSRIYICIDK